MTVQEEEHRQSDAINSRQALVRLALFGTAFIGAVGGLGVICSNIKSQLQNLAAAFDGGLQDQAQAVYPQKFTIVAPVVLQNDKSEDAGDGVPEADVAALAKRPHGTIGEACQRLVDRETKGTDGVNVALEQFNDVFEFPNPGLHEIREKCNFREGELVAALMPALKRGDEEVRALVSDDIRASCGVVPMDPFDPNNPHVIEYNTKYAACDELREFSPQDVCRLEHVGYRIDFCHTKYVKGATRTACEDEDKARTEYDCADLSTEVPYKKCVDQIDAVDNPEREARELAKTKKEDEEFEACVNAKAAVYGVDWDTLKESGGD